MANGFGTALVGLSKGVPAALAGKSTADPNTAILQSIENGVNPDPYFNMIALNNLAQGSALAVPQSNNVSINSIINSLVTGEIWVYLNAGVTSNTSLAQAPPPAFRLVAGGAPELWFPAQVVQQITLYSVSTTAAFGSIILMQQ